MKKLLEKLSQDKQESTTKQGEFERRLDAILKRYKISNTSFATEVINLHKDYWSWYTNAIFIYYPYFEMINNPPFTTNLSIIVT